MWCSVRIELIDLLTCTCIGFDPGRVEPASSRASTAYRCLCCSLRKILWNLIERRVPTHPRENAVCCRFSTDALTEGPEAASLQEQTPPGFSPEPGCGPNTARCLTNPAWVALPGTEVLDGIALALPIATTLSH